MKVSEICEVRVKDVVVVVVVVKVESVGMRLEDEKLEERFVLFWVSDDAAAKATRAMTSFTIQWSAGRHNFRLDSPDDRR